MSARSRHAVPEVSPDALSASGRTAEKLSLPALQSKMKCDPEGYETELTLLYSQFNSSLELFQQQAALNFTSISGIGSDPTVAKDLGDRATFLAHVTPFYPKQLFQFPKQLADFLRSAASSLPSSLRCHIVQALILLINRKIVDIGETLALFMELQTLGDKALRKLAFSHVVHSIKRMNQKHKNEAKNRALQNILFAMLQQEEEAKAKVSLIVLCDLHRRKVWFDDRTANAICTACFHTSPRIMIAALSFLLDYEKIEDYDDSDSDDSSSEDDLTTQQPHAVLSREAVYKAHHKGTASSKKKKKAKLQRAIRSMKRQQRMSSENSNSNYYSPLNHLKDAQGFAEKLFSRLQTCNERFEVKMMMLKVIARTVGLHGLILLNFYPFLQKYVQPHQRDVTNLLAAAVQACHDMVPPDAVEPLFKQIVNQFVHDHSRTESIAVGLNVVREICLRMPLLMTEDLLQDLVLYKKSKEKAVSSAARSLITLFREVCPALLIKKDRGRPTDPKARPKAFGEVDVASNVSGVELLQHDEQEDDSGDTDNYGSGSSSDDDQNDEEIDSVEEDDDNDDASHDEENQLFSDDTDIVIKNDFSVETESEDDEEVDDEDDINCTDNEDDASDKDDGDDDNGEECEESNCFQKTNDKNAGDNEVGKKESKAQKRKFSDFDGQLNAADTSLRALKKLAGTKMGNASLDTTDGILSNEDFQQIKELKAKKEARIALTQHGLLRKGSDSKSTAFKIPSSDQLSAKRVDPAKLELHVRKKLSKEEKLALVRAGREERGKYQARAAVKQKKSGGSSNRQKEHKKAMPLAAKRAKVARSRQDKKKKQQRSGKQFRGKKAWK
uniref:Protein SDA1 n=1 Tax=Davidia involucrata TaxID=16924 RepID=A0A5B7BA91_DAVIN